MGELLQRQSRLEAIHQGSPFWERRAEFGDELEGMSRVVRELREHALDIRTTPVRRVLDRFPRVAAELAHSLGKKVRVELSGEEVELDRAVLDYLYDPLLHLVRNSLDHGIEKPDERVALGKPEAGTIRLSAAARGGRVRVRVEDDGAGIDVERVRARAVEQGLLVEAVAEDLPPERILEFVFEPGLTTRSSVTSVSGRGVGMDAVKRGIESLGGTMEVQSRRGEGTAFEIDLPSVVALQRVVIVETAGERVALPAVSVVAVMGLSEGQVEGAGPDAFFVWGEEPLPLVDLAARLGLETPPDRSRGAIVVIEMQAFRLGLRVDRVAAHLEVFVRKVPTLLGSIPLLGGGAILPDGVPVFLLEVGQLVEELS